MEEFMYLGVMCGELYESFEEKGLKKKEETSGKDWI